MTRFCRLVYPILTYALLGSTTGLAQSEPQDANLAPDESQEFIELSPDDLAGDVLQDFLGTSITIASRAEEELASAPSSVTVFTRAEIRALGITDLNELLNYVPGLQSTRDVERGTSMRISARGRGSGLSEYVLLLINGQRLNDVYTGGISIINRHLTVDNVKQVEIIRGPGSALYGSNAFLAVINVVTTTEGSEIIGRAGTLDMRQGAVGVAYSDGEDGLRAAAFAGASSDEGQIYTPVTDSIGQTRETKDPRSGIDLYATVGYRDLDIHLRHMERNFRDFMPLGVLQWESSHETTKQTSVQASYQTDITSWLDVQAVGSYVTESWQLMSRYPPGTEFVPGQPAAESISAGPMLSSFTGGVHLGFQIRPFADNQLQVGASYEQQSIPSALLLSDHLPTTGQLTPDGQISAFNEPFLGVENRRRHIIGAYIQDKHSFGTDLDVTAGLRADIYNDFGSSFNPRLAIVYKTWFDSVIKLIYGRAFRAPNVLELYERSPITAGNSALQAEQIDTIEMAYSQRIGSFNVTATGFLNSILNEIIIGPPPQDVVPMPLGGFINRSGRVQSQGIEAELAAYPITGLAVRASFTHLIANPANGSMPNNFASLLATYQWRPLTLGIRVLARDQTPALPTQEAYVLMNANLGLQLSERLQLTGSVHNILDTPYRTVTTTLPEGVANRGRVIQVGFAAEY